MNKYTFNVPAAAVKALTLFMAKADVRYYLNGVHVDLTEPGKPVLVATDGHRMLIIDITKFSDAKTVDPMVTGTLPTHPHVTIPAAAVAKLKPVKGMRRGDYLPYKVTLHEPVAAGTTTRFSLVTVEPGDGSQAVHKTVEGQYPDWRRVVPRTEGCMRLQGAVNLYQIQYLTDAVQALVHLGLSSESFMTFPLEAAVYIPIAEWDAGSKSPADILKFQHRPLVLPSTNGVQMVIMNKRA